MAHLHRLTAEASCRVDHDLAGQLRAMMGRGIMVSDPQPIAEDGTIHYPISYCTRGNLVTHWAERLKPAASRRTHLLLASVMWTVVGALLLCFGARWVLGTRTSYASLQIAAAVVVGAAKAWFVLDKAAGRIVQRIRERGDGCCLGGFVSLKTWALVLLMVGMGRLLRGGLLSQHIVGLLYTAIGTALLLGARNFWQAWHREHSAG